jgi:phage I-like protein
MTRQTNPLIVLAQAMELPNVAEAPEWVHLLPTAKGQITTFDGRGPYVIEDAAAVIQASMAEPRGIPVDENHSTNLAAPQGREAPARGWITAMEARADGIWGQVDWTATGRALMADRAYRGVSPVFILNADGRSLARISVVSLVNKPNLRGLASLHQENDVDMSKIAKALGLADDATEDAILAKIAAMADKKPDAAMTAMQSAMTEIGTALGVDGANTTAIVAAVKGKAAESTALVALQAQVAELTKTGKRAASEAYVDAEMAKKRAGLNATSREDYVALHMEQPDVAKKLIEAMPMLGTSHAAQAPVVDAGGKLTALNAEQTRAAALLGIPPETYLTTLNAERAAQTETF